MVVWGRILAQSAPTNSRSYHSQHKQPGILHCCPCVSSAHSPSELQVSPLGVKVMFLLGCLVLVSGTSRSLHQDCVWSSISMLGIRQTRYPQWKGDQCGWDPSGWLFSTSFPARQLPWGLGGFGSCQQGPPPGPESVGWLPRGNQGGGRGNRLLEGTNEAEIKNSREKEEEREAKVEIQSSGAGRRSQSLTLPLLCRC